MNNKAMKLGLLAAMMVGGLNAAHATNTVQIEGTVGLLTCQADVTNPGPIRLTTASPTDFTTVGALVNKVDVSVKLTNCSGTPDGTATPKLRITGPETSLGKGYFNSESSPSFGIGIQAKNTTTLLGQNDTVSLGTDATTSTELQNASSDFEVGMVSPTSNPAAGLAKATLTFDYLYN